MRLHGAAAVLMAMAMALTAAPAFPAAGPAATGTGPAKRDRERIALLACPATDAAAIEGISFALQPGSGGTHVTVRCPPHRIEAQLLVSRTSSCTAQGSTWVCGQPEDALLVSRPDGASIAVIPRGMEPAAAVQAVIEAAHLTVPPFHRPATAWLRDTCTVQQLPTALFRGATHYDIHCGGYLIKLTRHCWNQQCRHFIAEGREAPSRD